MPLGPCNVELRGLLAAKPPSEQIDEPLTSRRTRFANSAAARVLGVLAQRLNGHPQQRLQRAGLGRRLGR